MALKEISVETLCNELKDKKVKVSCSDGFEGCFENVYTNSFEPSYISLYNGVKFSEDDGITISNIDHAYMTDRRKYIALCSQMTQNCRLFYIECL